MLTTQYCLTDAPIGILVRVSVTPITRQPLMKWMACLLLLGALSFDLCYDLDLYFQDQAVGALFIGMCLPVILSKVQCSCYPLATSPMAIIWPTG